MLFDRIECEAGVPMLRTVTIGLVSSVLIVVCSASAEATTDVSGVSAQLDDFHLAATQANEGRYFSHFAPEGVFLGTDPTERWTVAEFQKFAHPYFAKGKAWTYEPRDRHVVVTGDFATFDEALHNAKYGICRGTGALRRIGGEWKIVQYSLSFPVQNALAEKVVALLKGG
jgi:hypothetical protein